MREEILTLRIIIQKRIRKNKQTFIVFLDSFFGAFDNVNQTLMFKMMTTMEIKYADRKLLYNLKLKINKGVRQESSIPNYIQEVIDKIKEDKDYKEVC